MTSITPRTEAGLSPVVRSFNRITVRPLLTMHAPLVVAHYTGVNRRYAGSDTAAAIRSINAWKPNEYNYVIDQTGKVWEFAGVHQAAHAKNFNHNSYGVLFLNGVNEPLTDAQLDGFRFLTGVLMWTQNLFSGAWVVGHREIAATACPGPMFARMGELRDAAASHSRVAA